MDFHRSLEMSVSREEFFRLLPAAVGPFEADGELARGTDGDRRWNIRLAALPDLHLGSAVLPRHRVEIVLEACSEAESEAFMARFHRAFLRGGG